MVTRPDIKKRIKDLKIDISLKTANINRSIKKSRFRGLTIKKQFDIGDSKTKQKSFRRKRKAERRQGFIDVGLFTNQKTALKSSLLAAEDDLFVFDNILLQDGKI